MSVLTNRKMIDVKGREFLIQRLEALDQDRKDLHNDIRKAGHDPDELEDEVRQRKNPIQEYDL